MIDSNLTPKDLIVITFIDGTVANKVFIKYTSNGICVRSPDHLGFQYISDAEVKSAIPSWKLDMQNIIKPKASKAKKTRKKGRTSSSRVAKSRSSPESIGNINIDDEIITVKGGE